MPKHFDVVFSNPPYNDGLDLKLIQMLLDENVTEEVIAVHPGIFLFNHNNNKDIEQLKQTKALKEVTFFWGNGIFDNTQVNNVHCISVWNKNYNNEEITVHDHAFTNDRTDVYNIDNFTYTINVNDVTVHSRVAKKAAKLIKQFINCDSILNHITNIFSSNKTDFGFKFPTMINGFGYDKKHPEKRDYGMHYACFANGKQARKNAEMDKTKSLSNFIMTHKGYTNNYPLWFFNTEEERENFINYCKLKCVRFLLSLIKHNAELNTTKPCRIIPWMDFTKHYSEEDLKKAWGIDEELWDYIDKFIPDYYEDYRKICRGDIK